MDERHRSAAAAIARHRNAIARALTERHFQAHPELEARYGPGGRAKCHEDAAYHLAYLEQSVALASGELFMDYVAWATIMLGSRGVPEADLADHLRSLLAVVREALSDEEAALVGRLAAPALERLPAASPGSVAPPGSPAHEFLALLRQSGPAAAQRKVDELLHAGLEMRELYVDVLQPSLQEIGRLWQVNHISVADEHYLTGAMQLVMAQLDGRLFARAPSRPPVVLACVPGELHEIGARMVADLLQLEGFDSYFLGANTPLRDLVQFLAAKRAAVLGLSATTAMHLSRVESAVQAVRADARTAGVRIVVGGAPFARVPGLWRTIGADAPGGDARQAVQVVASLAA